MNLLRACCFLATCGASFAVQSFSLDGDTLQHRMINAYRDSTHEGLSHARCAMKCRRVPTCASINYHQETRTCELNTVPGASGVLDILAGWVFSDIDLWPQDIVGNCGSNPCASGQECVPSDIDPLCITGCGGVPDIANAVTSIAPATPVFGATVEYQCSGGASLVDPTSETTLTCLGSGKWSTTQFQCDAIP